MQTDQHLDSGSAGDRTYLESLIREDFERCHPGETLDDLKRRASFSKEDRGLLRGWMPVAASRAGAARTAKAHRHLSRSHPPLIRRLQSQARSKLITIAVQLGELPSSCETAAANCDGTNGLWSRTLLATPCDSQSRALAPVM